MNTAISSPIESVTLNQGAHALMFGAHYSRLEVRLDAGAIYLRPRARGNAGVTMKKYRHRGGLSSVKDVSYFQAALPGCAVPNGAYFNLVKSTDDWYMAVPSDGRHPQKPQLRIFRKRQAVQNVDYTAIEAAFIDYDRHAVVPSAALLNEALDYVEQYLTAGNRGRKPTSLVHAEILVDTFVDMLSPADRARVAEIQALKTRRRHQSMGKAEKMVKTAENGKKTAENGNRQARVQVGETGEQVARTSAILKDMQLDPKTMATLGSMFRAMADVFAPSSR